MLSLQNHLIGHDHPCFIIAEAGVNHNGDFDLACRLVDAAKEAGADAVKFQTFKAARIVTPDAPMAEYQKTNTGKIESQYELLRRLELPEDWHQALLNYCQSRGIMFLSTGSDQGSIDFLDRLGVPAFKTASGELTNLPYLEHIARLGKPIILSTGMGTLGETETALQTIERIGAPVVLLHCTSSYPTEPQDVNLRVMNTLRQAFNVPVGYSDHTLGGEVSIAAVALGACVIEKHLTLDKTLPGPDHLASMEPGPFKEMVAAIRTVEAAMGSTRKGPTAAELATAAIVRKSLVLAQPLPAGTLLEAKHLMAKRPGTGLLPTLLPHLLGRRTRVDLAEGTMLALEHLGE